MYLIGLFIQVKVLPELENLWKAVWMFLNVKYKSKAVISAFSFIHQKLKGNGDKDNNANVLMIGQKIFLQ